MNPNKDKILQAASEIFLEGGVEALSVRAIAARAGVSTIGIYSHFEGKQGILEALYIEGFEAVEAAMRVADEALTPRDAVLAAANNYFDFAAANPAHYSLVFGPEVAGYQISDAAREVSARAFSSLLRLTRRVLPEGSSVAMQQMAALRVWSLMHGAVSLEKHAVADAVNMDDFRPSVLEAVLILVDGFSAGNSA